MLVTARAVQGCLRRDPGAGGPGHVLDDLPDPKERAKAFSIFGAIGASGAAIGLLLGGALTQWASWRWCLFINLFFAAIAIVGVIIFVGGGQARGHTAPRRLRHAARQWRPLLRRLRLRHAVNTGWGNYITWGSLVIGVALLVAFVQWQQRSKNPLLPLRLVINRVRGGSLVALFSRASRIFGISLFLAYYLQTTLGYSPLRTGVAFLPLVFAIALSAFIASARLLAGRAASPRAGRACCSR
jgi:MFS family permease